MRITPLLVAGNIGCTPTVVSVTGDVLTIDGIDYDLSAIGEGDLAEWADSPISGTVTRTGGEIVCSVVYIYDPAPGAVVDASIEAVITSGALPDPVVRL